MVIRRHTVSRHNGMPFCTARHAIRNFFGYFSLVAITIFMFITGIMYFTNASSSVAHANNIQQLASASYADTVLVMDNVNHIHDHDMPGYRFDAAQLFVDLAPLGDEIGLVKITSSSTPNPPPILPLQPVIGGRTQIKTAIQSIQAGGVDMNSTAYFTPALQAADTALKASPAGHRKYVIIITDSLALSGDPNAGCGAPLNQQWLCEVDTLESHGISVVLLGFTPPGRDDEFLTTETALQAHKASAIKMVDNTSFAVLAEHYTDLLVRIHPSLFSATLNGLPLSITTTANEALARITFLLLGNTTKLASVASSGGQKISDQTTSDNTLYFSSGRGYTLQTIGTGNLVGQWQMTTTGTAPTETIVIAQSQGNLQINNPAPSGDDLSVRYIPPGQQLLLLTSMSDTNGIPLNGVTLIANPLSEHTLLTNNAIPGYPNTLGTIINAPAPPALNSNTTPLFIGLGQSLTNNPPAYFTKTFQLAPQDALKNQGVNIAVPASPTQTKPLGRNASITLNAHALPGTPIQGQSLKIFVRDATNATNGWNPITTTPSNGGITGDYSPPRGCGVDYIFAAFAEVSGTLNNAPYDYLTYTLSKPFTSYTQSFTQATPTPVAPTYLGWWSSTAMHWQISIQSTVCTPQTLIFTARPAQHASNVPTITIPGGSLSANISGNTQTNFALNATISSCGIPIFSDQQATYQLIPASMSSGNTFLAVNAPNWKATVTCPSIFTNSRRYWPLGIISWFLFTVIVVRGFQFLILLPLTAPIRKLHLVGKVIVDVQAANPSVEQLAGIQTSIPINIPPARLADKWYLESLAGGGYRLTTRETPELALLQFSAKREGRSYSVNVSATRYAKGEKLPIFLTTQQALEQTPTRCIKGNAIVIKNDIIYPDLDIAVW